MSNFHINDYVKWEKNGTTHFGRIVSVNKKTVTVFIDYDWVEKVPFSELTYLPPNKLNRDDYKAIVKLEKDR